MPTVPSQTFNGYTIPEMPFTYLSITLSQSSGDNPRIISSDSIVAVGGYLYSSNDLGFSGAIFASNEAAILSGEMSLLPKTLISSYTYDDKTVYFIDGSFSSILGTINNRGARWLDVNGAVGNKNIISLSPFPPGLAWLMVYGGYIDGFNVTYDLDGCAGTVGNPDIIPPNAVITNFDFIPDNNYNFVFNSVYIDGEGFPGGTPVLYDWNPDTGHLKIGPITSNIVIHVHAYIDPYADLPVDGETDIPGGDVVPVPSLPGLGAVSAGVIGLFAPSPSQMQALANYMWTDFGGSGTTVEDILGEIVEAIKRLIANPLDYVVGLNIIPSQGLSIGSDRTIRFGFTNSGVSMPQLTSQYFIVDCGTLRFDALCGDTFLDYAPYSKFSIYLPYVGIKDVDANDFIGHTIGVVYHGDVVTGGVTAYITKDGSVMYQYSGCCALNVPLTSDSWGATISGAVQIATSLVSGGFAGGAAGVAESAVKGAASVAANPSLLSPKVAHSGAVSGGAGCMGIQTPFVIREAVRFHSTVGMNTVSGYPSYYFKSLGSVSGYTVVLDVHLKGIPATSDEINEIESLLKTGVVL